MMHGKKQWRQVDIKTLVKLLLQQRQKKLTQVIKEEGYRVDIIRKLFTLSLDCTLLLDNQIIWCVTMYDKNTGKAVVDLSRKEKIIYGKNNRGMAAMDQRL